MWNFIINFVICIAALFGIFIPCTRAMCSPVYGEEPCPFVPAPPGHTPPCARPGDTFCEHIQHYPMQHIRYLIDKWGYDYATLFNDESHEDFNTYFTPPDYHGYGGSYNNDNSGYGNHYPRPEPIHIPKPPPGAPQYSQPSNKYIPPSTRVRNNYTETFAGYPDRRRPVKYSNHNIPTSGNHIGNYNGNRGHAHHGSFVQSQGSTGYNSGYYGNQGISFYDPSLWWRYARDNKNTLSRNKRFTTSTQSSPASKKTMKKKIYSLNDTNKNTTLNEKEIHQRAKRQAALGGAQQLCPTTSQFIMPRAALNNKGNWMYVVNLSEQDNRYTQLVRSEVCASQQCNGLCAVPTGYTARCEQRYVQKRLVALEGAGQNLYTDIFWFPSCCVCTFTNG